MRDRLAIFEGAGVRMVACVAPRLLEEASRRHGLGEGSAAALGQALCGALLLAAHLETRTDVQLDCPGPLRGMLADADETGAARGLVKERELPASYAGGRFDPKPLLATGSDELAGRLSVVRAGPPLSRTVFPFAGADLGAALTLVLRGDGGKGGEVALVSGPGMPVGVLIAPLVDEEIDAVRVRGKPLRQGGLFEKALPREIEEWPQALGLPELQPVQEVEPRFSCRCSRERIEAALRTLAPDDLELMADEDGGATCNCDFCGRSYRITAEELRSYAARPA
jgi:molecular chaperone Hsp33